MRFYTPWLLQADVIIRAAESREKEPYEGMQFVTFWGQTQHWSRWRTVWLHEKRLLQKKYKLTPYHNKIR